MFNYRYRRFPIYTSRQILVDTDNPLAGRSCYTEIIYAMVGSPNHGIDDMIIALN